MPHYCINTLIVLRTLQQELTPMETPSKYPVYTPLMHTVVPIDFPFIYHMTNHLMKSITVIVVDIKNKWTYLIVRLCFLGTIRIIVHNDQVFHDVPSKLCAYLVLEIWWFILCWSLMIPCMLVVQLWIVVPVHWLPPIYNTCSYIKI